jgi:hypothetical protein
VLGFRECSPYLVGISDDINAVGVTPGSVPHKYILPSV